MEKKVFNLKKLSILFLLLTAFAFLFLGFSLRSEKGFADGQESTVSQTATAQLFMPSTALEHTELSSPTDVYSDETLTAIIQNDSDLLIYLNGEFLQHSIPFEALKQVKRFDEDNIIVADNGSLYLISLSELESITSLDDKKLSGGNYFDINSTHLVCAFSESASVYTFDGENLTDKKTFGDINANRPIALNENGQIFYVSTSNKLCMRAIDNLNVMTEIDTDNNNSVPDEMIADTNFIYYILNSDTNVHKIDILTKERSILTANINDRYELGYIKTSPSGISFKGENLLISDSVNNTVQEFKVNGDALTFTGFAIAKGKTAYNRIADTVKDVEKYENRLAVLDGYKLTLINIEKGFDKLNPENYKDYLSDSELGAPDTFVLGKNTALFSYRHGTSLGEIKILNLLDDSMSQALKVFDGNIIRDLCYQSGNYYVLTDNGTNRVVYAFTENGLTFEPISVLESTINATKIHVDVFKNIHLYSGNTIYKYSTLDNYQTASETQLSGTILKINSDLSGKIFALKENSIIIIDNNAQYEITLQNLGIDSTTKANAFAFDFIDDTAYFTYSGQEFIYSSNSLQNVAISTLSKPLEYITTNKNADLSTLKSYKPKTSANVYEFEILEQSFNYKQLVNNAEEYAYICTVKLGAFEMYALAGQNRTVLINALECDEVEITKSTAPEKVYTTTKVKMYYLPVLIGGDAYCLTDGDKIVIDKNSIINPTDKITFLNVDYYFAKAEINGIEYLGYVPVSSTVEVLSKDFTYSEYRTETAKATYVYNDNALTEMAFELVDGSQVKVIEQSKNALKIAYENQGEWVIGYIDAGAIYNKPNTSIRNILIILALSACVCGTATYFVLRKKVK